MQDILSAKSPYSLIKEAEGLITAVRAVNSALISVHRTEACRTIDDAIAAITQDIEAAEGDAALRSACLGPLQTLRSQVEWQESIAHISQADSEALTLFDAAQGESRSSSGKPQNASQ